MRTSAKLYEQPTLEGPTLGILAPNATLSTQLSSSEAEELACLEAVISRGMRSFLDVGQALSTIKERQLYRSSFPTFEAYCSQKWEIHRRHAYRLIDAVSVCQRLTPLGASRLPANERQVRPLVGLPPKTLGKVWKRVIEEADGGHEITGSLVKKIVIEITGTHQARSSHPTKEHWQTQIEELLKSALSHVHKGEKQPIGALLERISLLLLIGEHKTIDE